jgi:uncharacterized damage-inducible protein DinB
MSRRAMLIEALAATPRDLARMLKRVSPEQSLFSPEPSSWSIVQVVAHLAWCEEQYLARLQRIVMQEQPHEAAFATDIREHESDLPMAFEAFSTKRAATIAYLEGLEQRDWARQFTHATQGPMRLRDQVQAMVAHDNEHLEQIAVLRNV